ncbi:MAG: hypothetical protein FWE06_09950 [Oscillospiraceae bacterium]|nr:hypothetical protein [Oscillospiraceae bacterium]
MQPNNIQVGETVFALWKSNGCYYPATVKQIAGNTVDVAFLDGSAGQVSSDHVIPLQDAYNNLSLQGNWENGGEYYDGTILSQNPLTMLYSDGNSERINLAQLRGKIGGKSAPPNIDECELTAHCRTCGAKILDEAVVCPHCGIETGIYSEEREFMKTWIKWEALSWLWWLLGLAALSGLSWFFWWLIWGT